MLISQHINFSRLNNKQHKAQAARLCLGRHVCSAGLLPSGGEHHYAQVNETKEKKNPSIPHLKKKTQKTGQGRVIYQSQTESGTQDCKKQRRKAPSSVGLHQNRIHHV